MTCTHCTRRRIQPRDRQTDTARISSNSLHPMHSMRLGVMVNIVGWINEVNQRRARLVLGWVTIFMWLNHLGM